MSRLSDVPKKVLYNPNTSLGEAEPYVFMKKTDYSAFIEYWHVSEHEIFRLVDGCGYIVGRQEYGPFNILTIFNWSVFSNREPTWNWELKKVQDLKEWLFE